MTASRDLKELLSRTRSATFPLRGQIVHEDESELWVREAKRTWMVRKADVVEVEGIEKTEGARVCVLVRDKAQIYQIVPTQIDLSDLPITLTDPRTLPAVRGRNRFRGPPFVTKVGVDQVASWECTPWTTTCWTGPNELTADDSQCDWVDY